MIVQCTKQNGKNTLKMSTNAVNVRLKGISISFF